MIKKMIIIIGSFFIVGFLSAQIITSGEHYTEDFVNSLLEYKTIFSVSIENRQLDILAVELPLEKQQIDEKYNDVKILVLKDENKHILDAMGAIYVDFTQDDKTYISNEIICLRVQGVPLNGFAYIHSTSTKIAIYESTPMLSGFVVTDEYIVYSYTRSTPALFKISLATSEITPYNWDAPSAVLYPSPDKRYIAFFEKNYRDPTQYAVTETEIVKLEKDFVIPKILRLSDFRVH